MWTKIKGWCSSAVNAVRRFFAAIAMAIVTVAIGIASLCSGPSDPAISVTARQVQEQGLQAPLEEVRATLEDADEATINEVSHVGPGVECHLGESYLDNDPQPKRGWMCCSGGGCVMMPPRVQAGLDRAHAKRKARQ